MSGEGRSLTLESDVDDGVILGLGIFVSLHKIFCDKTVVSGCVDAGLHKVLVRYTNPVLVVDTVDECLSKVRVVEERLVTEFRQPLQVQSHLEMPRILVQLGHTQRTWKLAPQTDPKWSPTWSLTRFQPICPLRARDGRYACQVSRAHRTHSRL